MQDTKSKKLNIPKVTNLEVSITVSPKTVSNYDLMNSILMQSNHKQPYLHKYLWDILFLHKYPKSQV